MLPDLDIRNRLAALQGKLRNGFTTAHLVVTGAFSVAGVAFPVAGVYTPTITNGANVAASSANDGFYIRVGAVALAFGRFDIDPTAATTLTVFDVSLPIASNLGALADLAGIFVNGGLASGNVGEMHGDASDDRAECAIVPAGAGNISYLFLMAYRII